ncbi:MAG: nitroreductase [Clostridia bacterium]|nr:nitroreductase [Clostridia bacterium]
MESTITDLITRRSIRKFKPEQIKKEELNKILEAGTYAPSGMGAQSSKIVVIQDKDTKNKLSKMNANIIFPDGSKENFDPFYGAPTIVLVLADPNVKTYIEDGSLVLGNLMNAAHAIGIGSCWIHRAKEEFESSEGKELLKKWNIPDSYVGVGHCILGYPADNILPTAKPRKSDYIVYIKE